MVVVYGKGPVDPHCAGWRAILQSAQPPLRNSMTSVTWRVAQAVTDLEARFVGLDQLWGVGHRSIRACRMQR
jgi:hypothetical protein